MTARPRGLPAAAAILALLSLGLPWSPLTTGAWAPSRVAIVVTVALVVVGLRTGRERLLPMAAAAGLAGVLLGGLTPSPGRLALAAAVGCLVVGLRASGRPVLPGRRTAAG